MSLKAELKQARIQIAEMEERRDSLCSGYVKLENECKKLRVVVKTMKQEKTETISDIVCKITDIVHHLH
jgi:chromosome segregation ATPase